MRDTLVTRTILAAASACLLGIDAVALTQDTDILGSWERSAAAPAPVQGTDTRADVTGTWSFQVEIAAGSGTPTMKFKQEGAKLSGRYTGQLGEAPLAGTVKGTAVEFSFDVTVEGNQLHIVYAGTVEKDSMKGTVNLGGLGEGTFTAKKKS